jgi:cellobiose-specific phosphotransferase system component IIA
MEAIMDTQHRNTDTCDALEKHLRKAHDDVQNAHALVETLTETLKDDGTALSVLLMIEKKISKAWDHLDYADIERSKQKSLRQGGAA